MKLNEAAEGITDKASLVKFLGILRNDLAHNKVDWENSNLETYLEAMQAWIADMDGYYKNRGTSVPLSNPWQLIADILHAATMYE